jgi:uncharacterized protein YgbK (DUF1537 family)
VWHVATVADVLLPLLVAVQELCGLLQAAAGIAASAVSDPAQRAAMLASAALPFAGKKLVLAGNCLQMPRIVERIRGKYAVGQLQTMLLQPTITNSCHLPVELHLLDLQSPQKDCRSRR